LSRQTSRAAFSGREVLVPLLVLPNGLHND
jgi:hypothetical protein